MPSGKLSIHRIHYSMGCWYLFLYNSVDMKTAAEKGKDMDPITITNQSSTDYSLANSKGIGNVILVVFLSLWVIAFSAVNLLLRWTIEQSMFEAGTGIADARWLIQLGYALLVFVPLLVIYIAVKAPRIKLMLGLWLIGGLFALLSVPAKTLYLTAQFQSLMLLTLILGLMIAIVMLLPKKVRQQGKKMNRSYLTGAAVLAGVGLATPWAMWGALGSILDTLLAIIIGCAFAFFIIRTIYPFYFDLTQPAEATVKRGEYLFDGFVLAVFLLICVTALSQNGSQLLLTLVLPPAGWVVAVFATAGRNRADHGRLAVGILSALALILPLAFFDMDELALVVSGTTTGEVFYWAQRAGWYSLIFLVSLALVILIFHPLHEKMNIDRRINLGLIVLSLVEFLVVYIFAGQPGFFGDRLFVIMQDQVDVTSVTGESLAERKSELYSALTRKSDGSQEDLRVKLSQMGIDYTPYYLVNALEVNAGWFTSNMIAKFEGVDRVLESPRLRPLPQVLQAETGEVQVPHAGTSWNLDMINVPQVHDELGVTGDGIVIGQTDSGVDVTHPELAHNYRGANGTNDYAWLDPWNHSVSPVDLSGHGTGTLGIISGETRGIAPESEWIGCVNLARNLGNPALYLDCMQFMFAPYPQGGDPFKHGDVSKAAMIINNSWGCPQVEGCDPGVFDQAVSVLKSAGIFMSAAAGNNGYYGCSTIADPPSIYGQVFTVGAVDKLGRVSAFSSRGPVVVDGSGRAKPDLLAPGEQVLISAPGGTYTFSSGTSFAAPHVSGVVALMWSANPDLIGNIDATVQILMDNAQPYTGPAGECGGIEFEAGAGILDAYAAVQAALNFK